MPYEAVAPDCDEDAIRTDSPDETARLRAIAKAVSVARERPDALVIGADQVVDLDGELLGKPGSAEGARAQLGRLAGRVHRLITAVAFVVRGNRPEVALDVHRMSVRPLDEAEIGRYVAADDPAWCAGSYKVESLGIALFDRIEGDDATAIVGLPLMAVCSMLRRSGWALP
ncbi:MAG: Maf family nucleotide pyrophosphatase [Myxococcota bacterium]|nr:Maf family nucleotide pyrophosphatase [Myxococcota bacterium]